MNGEWIPEGILEMTPKWRNFFENTATVQFDHRILALSTLASIGVMYTQTRFLNGGRLWVSLPKISKIGLNMTAGMALCQVTLGISTLLLCVPVSLAAVHQAGSLVLLSCITFLCHTLRLASYSSITPGLLHVLNRSIIIISIQNTSRFVSRLNLR
jgi:cytochrome c oxidase assembly protein subunit 15